MSRGYGTSSGSRSCGKRSPRRIARRSRRRRGSTARGRVLDHSARSISTLHGLRAYARTRCFFLSLTHAPILPICHNPTPFLHLAFVVRGRSRWRVGRLASRKRVHVPLGESVPRAGGRSAAAGNRAVGKGRAPAGDPRARGRGTGESRTSRAQVARKSRASLAHVAHASRTSRAHKSHTQVPHKSHTRLPPHRSHVISHPNLTTQASHAFPPHSSQRH